MFSPYYLTRFPFWKFLNQPIFAKAESAVFNPYRFWQQYQLDLLERCLKIDCPSGDVRRD